MKQLFVRVGIVACVAVTVLGFAPPRFVSAATCGTFNVQQAFRAQRPTMVPGNPVVVYPYAIIDWTDEEAGGQALLRHECPRGWVLLSAGGGVFDVSSLESEGVPPDIASRLIAEHEASLPTPSPKQTKFYKEMDADIKVKGEAAGAERRLDFRSALTLLEKAAAMDPERAINPCVAASDSADVQAMKEAVGLLESGTIQRSGAYKWFMQREFSLLQQNTGPGSACQRWQARRSSP